MRGCLEICFHGPGNGVSALHPSSAIKFACKSDPLANARATRQTKSAFWKKRCWPFFPYTAYTISCNGGYSSFLDLFHGIRSCRKGVRKSRPRAGRIQGHTSWTRPRAFDKSLRQSYNDHSTGRQKACRGRQKPHWEVPEEPKAGPCRICFFGTLCRQGTCRKGHRERKEDAAPCFCAIPVGW